MRAAIYLRLSTDDQTTANQERELRAAAPRPAMRLRPSAGIQAFRALRAGMSGPPLHKDAARRRFDVVMAWSVDRRSLQDLCDVLVELHGLGIDLFLHQQGIDIARAKDAGKHCGRPRINPEVGERIRKAHGDPWQARHSGNCEAIRRIADDGAERGTG